MTLCCTSVHDEAGHGNAKTPPARGAAGFSNDDRQAMTLTSSGMPGPNVVETAPFWM